MLRHVAEGSADRRTTFAGPPGALNSKLNGITDGGVLVGTYSETSESPSRIFTYTAGTFRTFAAGADVSMTALGVSPNGRWIVGGLTDSQGQHGFVVDTVADGTMSTLDCAAVICTAAGVNNSGTVVGYGRTLSTSAGGGYVGSAWLYESSTGPRTDYLVAGAARVALRDIDASGTLSGYFGDARFDAAHGLVADGSAFQTIDVPSGEPTFVVAANDGGTLAGYYESGPFRESIGFIARPVPEPATAWMLALGISGLACAGRMRRRHREIGEPLA